MVIHRPFSYKLIELANSYVGLEEDTGNNDGKPTDLFAGGRKEPWCAHFVAFLYREAGRVIPGDVLPNAERANPLASVEHMERVFKEHGWHFREPAAGDVVFFRSRGRSDPARTGRHCGIVVSVSNREFTTIEGNSGNMVRRSTYRRDSPNVTGFGRILDA